MQVVIQRRPAIADSIAMKLRAEVYDDLTTMKKLVDANIPRHMLFKILDKMIISKYNWAPMIEVCKLDDIVIQNSEEIKGVYQ